MPTESKERAAVSAAYSGDKWAQRVKKMPDDQISAIYLRLKAQGKIR